MKSGAQTRLLAVVLAVFTLAALGLAIANLLQESDYTPATDGASWTEAPGGLRAYLVPPDTPAYRAGVRPGDILTSMSGQTIEIERSGHQTDWEWEPTVTALVEPGGAFTASWTTDHIGQFSIRAVLDSSEAEPAAVTQAMTVTVYLPSVASWYGPTLYGHGTACGEKLTKHILGVANKTLPCGENVALYYDGRTLTVPVIDRGPYIKGRRYDLTYATAKALGTISAGVATIGAVSLPTEP